MRVLFGCSMGGSGHLEPLLGVASAFIRQGHESVLLVPPSMTDAATASGMKVVTGAQPPTQFVDDLWQRVRKGPATEVVGLIDRELFAGRATDAMRETARDLCAEFGPDLVVRESCEYATAMTAYEMGVAQIQIGISPAAIEAGVLHNVAAELNRRCPGVAEAIRSAPYLTAFPAVSDPSPWIDTRRYRLPAAEPSPLPDWWPTMPERPLVYVTFGSVVGGTEEARSVYQTALDAVADLPVRVLMTVGRRFEIRSLEPVPSNARVERWVPQVDVLADADLVVCHGGSGTTNGVLAAGLPLVVCPLFADQTANAASVERLGAGVVVRSHRRPEGGVATLDSGDVTVLRAAIVSCLGTTGYRQAAQDIASSIGSEPMVDNAIRAFKL